MQFNFIARRQGQDAQNFEQRHICAEPYWLALLSY
ncbi:hypothetical protein DESC_190165 [Desulfosarcina cetonica]|nr:hypothetical protein DESC_190165 [Desulfosarcina cetonica]